MLHISKHSSRDTGGPQHRGVHQRRRARATARLWACRDESGAVAVEFALILVPFLVLIFGLIQYGMYFYSAQSGSHVGSRAVRQMSVGNCQNLADLKTYVLQQLGGATTASSTSDPKFKVTPSYVDSAGNPVVPSADTAVGGTVELTIEFPTVNMHFPFVPFLSDSTVKRTIDARIEDSSDAGCPS